MLSHFGWPATLSSSCLDVNGDGSIDLADALHVMSHSSLSPNIAICRSNMDKLEQYIAEAKDCEEDADCAPLDIGCSHVAEHCSRIAYVHRNTDQHLLRELTEASSICIGGESCRRCTETADPAVCFEGKCKSSTR